MNLEVIVLVLKENSEMESNQISMLVGITLASVRNLIFDYIMLNKCVGLCCVSIAKYETYCLRVMLKNQDSHLLHLDCTTVIIYY